jgi:hypothetical protein
MSDKRQKNQLVLAFTEEGRGEAPKASREGTESLTAKCETERPASHEQLMEEVCERENCWQAYKRVKANKGSPGIDGMKVGELSGYLKQHWPSIREQLLRGTYQPQPVRRVEIPKPDGGVRKLGIPRVHARKPDLMPSGSLSWTARSDSKRWKLILKKKRGGVSGSNPCKSAPMAAPALSANPGSGGSRERPLRGSGREDAFLAKIAATADLQLTNARLRRSIADPH